MSLQFPWRAKCDLPLKGAGSSSRGNRQTGQVGKKEQDRERDSVLDLVAEVELWSEMSHGKDSSPHSVSN